MYLTHKPFGYADFEIKVISLWSLFDMVIRPSIIAGFCAQVNWNIRYHELRKQ